MFWTLQYETLNILKLLFQLNLIEVWQQGMVLGHLFIAM